MRTTGRRAVPVVGRWATCLPPFPSSPPHRTSTERSPHRESGTSSPAHRSACCCRVARRRRGRAKQQHQPPPPPLSSIRRRWRRARWLARLHEPPPPHRCHRRIPVTRTPDRCCSTAAAGDFRRTLDERYRERPSPPPPFVIVPGHVAIIIIIIIIALSSSSPVLSPSQRQRIKFPGTIEIDSERRSHTCSGFGAEPNIHIM